MCQAEYFGFPADVCGAVALTAIVACALVTESDIYLKKHGGGKSAGTSFRRSMASRLQERIRALKIVPVSTGTALVVLKDQLVKAEFAKLGIRLTTVPSSSYKHNEHASASGRAAGDRVNIGQQSAPGKASAASIGSSYSWSMAHSMRAFTPTSPITEAVTWAVFRSMQPTRGRHLRPALLLPRCKRLPMGAGHESKDSARC